MKYGTSSEGQRAATWLDHYALTVLIVISTIGLVFGTLFIVWSFMANLSYTVAIGAALILNIRHDRRSCLWCITTSPDNAPALAQRKKRWLWLYHKESSVRRPPLLLLLLIMGIVCLIQLPLLTATTNAVFCGLSTALFYAHRVHRGLVIWCPWCRDDGPREPSPEPAPDPASTKVA